MVGAASMPASASSSPKVVIATDRSYPPAVTAPVLVTDH